MLGDRMSHFHECSRENSRTQGYSEAAVGHFGLPPKTVYMGVYVGVYMCMYVHSSAGGRSGGRHLGSPRLYWLPPKRAGVEMT